jgi:hypothetical protein
MRIAQMLAQGDGGMPSMCRPAADYALITG